LQIKAYLGERLPPYMIPAEIVCTEALPKTSTGKVDRRALAADARGPEQRPG
jgi:acyl-coenzyme A synthetase/AMP-(fatty) acid ligase